MDLPANFNDDDAEKIVKELFGRKDLDFKTDLDQKQIIEICKLRHIHQKYKINGIKSFIDNFLALQVSKNRKGRGEFINALKSERELRKSKDMLDLDRLMK